VFLVVFLLVERLRFLKISLRVFNNSHRFREKLSESEVVSSRDDHAFERWLCPRLYHSQTRQPRILLSFHSGMSQAATSSNVRVSVTTFKASAM
jgi:hypothetical protein